MMNCSSNTYFSYNPPPLPQPEPLHPTLQAQKPRPMQQMRSMYQPYLLSPPFCHSTGTPVSVTYVDQMTVDQTSIWIWTLGRFKGWDEAETYAKNFKENCITGQLLQELTAEMLEYCLGITNVRHRLELLSIIRQLFPNLSVGTSCMTPELVLGIEVLESACESKYDDSWRSLESDCKSTTSHTVSTYCTDIGEPVHIDSSGMMSESGYNKCSTGLGYSGSEHGVSSMPMMSSVISSQFGDNPDEKEDVVISDKPASKGWNVVSFRNRPVKGRKLILTLRPDQILQDGYEIERIRSRFEELSHAVEVVPCENRNNIYTIVFADIGQAQEALSKADEIGYKLAKKWPPRPGPRSPIKFKSLANLPIRAGKSLKGKIVGELEEGKIVSVNQVKGRRARLIEEKENGQIVTIGWVSVHSLQGASLLMQLGDY